MLELLNESGYIGEQSPFPFRYWSPVTREAFQVSIQYLEKKRNKPGVEIRTPDSQRIMMNWLRGQSLIEQLGWQVLPIGDTDDYTIELNSEPVVESNSPILQEPSSRADCREYFPRLEEVDGFPWLTKKLFRRGFLLSDGIRANDGSKRIELSGLVFPVYRPESNHTSLVIVSGEDFVSSEDREALNRLIFRCIALGNNISSHFFHDITLVYLEPKKGTFTSSEVYRF